VSFLTFYLSGTEKDSVWRQASKFNYFGAGIRAPQDGTGQNVSAK